MDALLYRTKRLTGYERSRLHEMPYTLERPVHPMLDSDGCDELTVYLGYSYRAGSPDSWECPGDPPEVELYEVTDERGCAVELDEDELDVAYDHVIATHEEDYPD